MIDLVILYGIASGTTALLWPDSVPWTGAMFGALFALHLKLRRQTDE